MSESTRDHLTSAAEEGRTRKATDAWLDSLDDGIEFTFERDGTVSAIARMEAGGDIYIFGPFNAPTAKRAGHLAREARERKSQ